MSAMTKHLLTGVLALACGFLGAAIWSFSGLAGTQIQAYLLANPEILPQMAQAYELKIKRERLVESGDELARPFPGAVLGNPEGSKTLVKFTDYNCGYCKSAHGDVARLVSEDKDLKVVMRELPLFDGSEEAARMALAAAKQGRYSQFHSKMFEFSPATSDSIARAAGAAGLDMDKARADAASPDIDLELARSRSLAQQMGFTGTPSWITGDQVIEGAQGYQALKDAVAAGAS